jgi:hypothetical protein
MTSRIISGAILVIATCLIGFSTYADSQPTLIKGYATAYTGESEYTCTGDRVREGICGGCKDYIGKTIVLYQRLPGDEVGEILGIWECLDTGTGTEGFQQGKVIDVWCPDLDECQKFMDKIYEDGCQGRCFIQVIEAAG